MPLNSINQIKCGGDNKLQRTCFGPCAYCLTAITCYTKDRQWFFTTYFIFSGNSSKWKYQLQTPRETVTALVYYEIIEHCSEMYSAAPRQQLAKCFAAFKTGYCLSSPLGHNVDLIGYTFHDYTEGSTHTSLDASYIANPWGGRENGRTRGRGGAADR